MLDLNDEVVGRNDYNNCDRSGFETNTYVVAKNYVLEDRQSEIHSATSVSSEVFNTDDYDPLIDVNDERSVSCIELSYPKGGSKENSRQSSVELITRQFFPVSEYLNSESELGYRITASSPSAITFRGADWLNLKVLESAPILQNVQTVEGKEKVRKRRRGPPSKSSPYRGVTYYRRTGRWESHIWYLFIMLLFFSSLFYCVFLFISTFPLLLICIFRYSLSNSGVFCFCLI